MVGNGTAALLQQRQPPPRPGARNAGALSVRSARGSGAATTPLACCTAFWPPTPCQRLPCFLVAQQAL